MSGGIGVVYRYSSADSTEISEFTCQYRSNNTFIGILVYRYWEDPDFDPRQDACCYVWVLEIPTPRWTKYDAAFFDIKRPDNVPATVQDRVYTSPMCYPAK